MLWFKQKHAEVNHSLTHALKSLTWFEDADKEPMPGLLAPLSWEDVKRFFSRLMKKSKRRLLCRTAAIVSSLFSA